MTEAPHSPVFVVVEPGEAGLRLDKLLAVRLAPLSRSRIQALLAAGAITLEGGALDDAGRKVKPAEAYRIDIPPPSPAEPEGEAIALDILYEDDHLIVIDKPPGVVVHPGAGHATGTLVNALIAHCGDSLSGIGGVRRPGIVHRLDKDTSGLLVVAKTDAAHQSLSGQFAAHGRDGRLERRYLALLWGAVARPSGTVDLPLARSTHNRTKIAVARGESGRAAITHWRRVATFNDSDSKPVASLVEVSLETGRTHQIRVHMTHIGHPVMGDDTYGAGFKTSASRLSKPAQDALAALGRQALHAAVLGFEHPETGETIRFERASPADMRRLIDALEAASPRSTGRTAQNQPLRRK